MDSKHSFRDTNSTFRNKSMHTESVNVTCWLCETEICKSASDINKNHAIDTANCDQGAGTACQHSTASAAWERRHQMMTNQCSYKQSTCAHDFGSTTSMHGYTQIWSSGMKQLLRETATEYMYYSIWTT